MVSDEREKVGVRRGSNLAGRSLSTGGDEWVPLHHVFCLLFFSLPLLLYLLNNFFFLHFDPQISLLLFIPCSFSIPLRGEVSKQLCSALLPTAVNPGSSMAYRYLLPTAQRESGCDHSCLPVTWVPDTLISGKRTLQSYSLVVATWGWSN